MNCHVDTHGEEIAFYLDGDLQFDSTDEAIYHEALALPPLCLASKNASTAGMRVLICGGGDGLALRETLRFPGVAAVDLVDYSREVVELGRTAFARLNHNAFADARSKVHIGDAWDFLAEADDGAYDVVLCDFSVPRRTEDTRVFTREWYEQTARVLKPGGFAGINGVSPQSTPAAFWCLHKTVRSAGLSPLPLRVCIPSFRDQGYGAWGFLIAAHRPLQIVDLRSLSACPVPTRAVDLAGLAAAATFGATERALEDSVAVHTVANDTLLPLLLNPTQHIAVPSSPTNPDDSAPQSLEALPRAVPTLHPYHTREMVESLAEQVIGTVRGLDLRRLIDAILLRAAELSDDLRRALQRLRAELERFDREYLTAGALQMGRFGEWAQRLLVALALLLTIANVVAPDNAFGKGSHGLGHASVSRGYGAEGGSFGRSTEGSFGRGPSGYAASRSRAAGGSFKTTSSMPDAPLSGAGFRGDYQRGQPTDIFGTSYQPRVFLYRDSYYYRAPYGVYAGGGGSSTGSSAAAAPEQQTARFVADDDMLVLDNGDVVITLSDTAYLLVSGGHVSLMNSGSPDPLVALYPDPRLFANITARLHDQKIAARHEVGLRRDWLSWVSWTAAMFSSVQADESEVRSLEDLERRLDVATQRVAAPANVGLPPDLPVNLAQNAIELFVDGGLLNDGRIALIATDGTYLFTDGKTLTNGKTNAPTACSTLLKVTLQSVLTKLQSEMTADQASLQQDLGVLTKDRQSLMSDFSTYSNLQSQYGSDYDVDYGTDEISAADAIMRTQSDLADNQADMTSTTTQLQETGAQIDQISAAIARFVK